VFVSGRFRFLSSKGTTMHIRPFVDSDLQPLTDLTIQTFRQFYEDYVHLLLGEEVFRHQHGQWEQDYRDELPTLHDPTAGRHVAVAQLGGATVGYVAWRPGDRPNSGQIYLLAVSSSHRRRRVGRQLCLHAIRKMRADGVEVVGIGTGDDAFHAAARALYESVGFTKIPTAAYLKKI
jgi:ribosomal protein S18 acetylase RimI-like enzyme